MAQQGFDEVLSRSADGHVCICVCGGKSLRCGAQRMDCPLSHCQHSIVSLPMQFRNPMFKQLIIFAALPISL